MMLNTSDIITRSNIKFGTSGLRGLVVDFTTDVSAAFVYSFIQCAQKKFDFKSVAVAIDNRPSSPEIAKACCDTLIGLGIEPIFCGVLPTPALANYCLEKKIPAIMITGSHIPFDRNGIKFYQPDGEISKQDESEIFNSSYLFEFNEKSKCLPEVSPDAEEMYVERYVSFFNNDLLAGKKIGIYEHSSAGRDIYSKVFSKLGAEVLSLERSENFVPIDTEAVTNEDRLKALKWNQQYALDAIFSTDGDGDRPLLADDKGEWLRGDILGILCSKALGINYIATPINSNSMIEKLDCFSLVKRTKIGSPYVIEVINELLCNDGTVAGFEANGGYILSSPVVIDHRHINRLPTRDALLPALSVLWLCGNKKLSEIVSALPVVHTASDRLQNFPNQISSVFLRDLEKDPSTFLSGLNFNESIISVNLLDGVRIQLENGKIIHLRASGNAPELRCYCESTSIADVESMVIKVLEYVKLFTERYSKIN